MKISRCLVAFAFSLACAGFSFAQGSPRDVAIIKFESAVSENLIILMAFACEQNDISAARFVHCKADGFFTVGFDQIFSAGFLETHDDVADDFQGIFGAWIVTGQDRKVAQTSRHFAHDWTFGAVFPAAAAEERDDAPFGVEFARRANEIFERVVGAPNR